MQLSSIHKVDEIYFHFWLNVCWFWKQQQEHYDKILLILPSVIEFPLKAMPVEITELLPTSFLKQYNKIVHKEFTSFIYYYLQLVMDKSITCTMLLVYATYIGMGWTVCIFSCCQETLFYVNYLNANF